MRAGLWGEAVRLGGKGVVSLERKSEGGGPGGSGGRRSGDELEGVSEGEPGRGGWHRGLL